MAGQFSGFWPDSGGAAFAPTAGVANWVLECIAGKELVIREFWWGGEVTAAAGPMRTRISRDSAVGTGARTAIATDRRNPNTAAAPGSGFLSRSYATTPPTISNASLFATPWISAGGQTIVSWQAGPRDGFIIVGAISAECRADIGTDASGYGVAWDES
jgi:hypothetical protein